MKKPTNTTEETNFNPLGFLAAAMVMGTSNAIEHQEARGQRELVNSESLPVRMNGARPILESLGFKFGEHDGRDLFIEVEMPKGWKKVPTDHSMWSNLLDDKGRVRGSIFYKAAFYDRDAFMNMSRRYSVRKDYARQDKENVAVAYVMDGETIIHTTEPIELQKNKDLTWYNTSDKATVAATEWLRENYPDWQNDAAYWD